MKKNEKLNFGEIILSISEMLDCASRKLQLHQQKVAYIALQIGIEAKLSQELLRTLFTAAIIHDVGAISLEEKISLHDDQDYEDVDLHCIRGQMLLERFPQMAGIGRIIRHHHTPWPELDSTAEDTALPAQILFLADTVERLIDRERYILHQNADIISECVQQKNILFSNDVVELFKSVSSREEFWLDLSMPCLREIVKEMNPCSDLYIPQSYFLEISELMKDIIDFKSRFTATHSTGVSAAAGKIAGRCGFPKNNVRNIRIAGNLHDAGKMMIPNSILSKNGKLTSGEYAIIKSHTYYTYHIIRSINSSDNIAEWSAFHHEKIDGSGYPFKCSDENLSMGSRIMAVADIFTALCEDRPYRAGMNRKEIIDLITKMGESNAIDKYVTGILLKNYDEIRHHVESEQQKSLMFYKNKFLNSDNYSEPGRTPAGYSQTIP